MVFFQRQLIADSAIRSLRSKQQTCFRDDKVKNNVKRANIWRRHDVKIADEVEKSELRGPIGLYSFCNLDDLYSDLLSGRKDSKFRKQISRKITW